MPPLRVMAVVLARYDQVVKDWLRYEGNDWYNRRLRPVVDLVSSLSEVTRWLWTRRAFPSMVAASQKEKGFGGS